MSLASYSNWRLPNVKKLRSIVDNTCYSPTIDLRVFPGTESNYCWSSSPHAYFSDYAWGVGFYDGLVSSSSKASTGYVRCVR